jgi:hypothetical protein
MDVSDEIVSLVSFASTMISKERHGERERKPWGNMGYLGETYGGMEERKVTLDSPLFKPP